MNRRAKTLTLTAALIAVAAVGWCYYQANLAAARARMAAAAGLFHRPPALVEVAPVVAQDVPLYIDEIGKCVAREVVTVLPQVTGRITQIHFADGADVKPGDLLFTIDPRPYQAALDQAQASLAQNRANLSLARANFQRDATLLRSRVISTQQFDTQKSTMDVAQAQVEASEAAVETAKLNLAYCSIRSPIEGRTGTRLVDVGNVVNANSTQLVVIERLDPIYVDFTISETDLSRVQQALKSRTLTAQARIPNDEDSARSGKLTFLDNTVQDATGTVKLRATLANSDHRFWPGRFVNVRLILDTLRRATLVPAAAVQMSAQGPYVYVIGPGNMAELRPVVPGQRQGAMMVIEKGLQPGERVVTLGQLAVMPGGRVRIASSGNAGQHAAGRPL